MGVKVKGVTSQAGVTVLYVFFCPGCRRVHPYRVARDVGEGPNYPVWTFNGSLEKPTFRASLLIYPTPPNPDGSIYQRRCHLFMTDGQIQFCSDSDHALAGQTVECPDWDDKEW